jgi:hypothetical protein
MKQLLFLFISICFFSCNNDKNKGTGDRPTEEDVIAAMKKAYEYTTSAGDVYKIEMHDIKIGNSEVANVRQELNEIPKGATVTNVDVDYSITGFINVRKKATLWVYKNEFGEWKFKANSGG